MSSLDNSGFNILMPGYYFRYKDGSPTSGSGCGNDTASELPMMRKFMIDSSLFLAKTYKLSGFRFDLMGLHDVETMNLLVKSLKENYNEDIVVYGEPWQMSTGTSVALAHQGTMSKWEGFAGFNDVVRDAIKGSVFDATSTGWATDENGSKNASYENITSSLLGATPGKSKDPSKNVAYVSCHDNNTIFDKMKLSVTEFDNNNPIPEEDMGADVLAKCADYSAFANSLVFASQGISFMNAGEELCRTKVNEDNSLNHNSYNATYKCNELDYSRLIDYSNIYEEYRMMISAKVSGVFPYLTSEEVEKNVTINKTEDKSYIDLTVKSNGSEMRIIFASAAANKQIDISGFDQIAGVVGQGTANDFASSKLQLTPATAYYFYK
jgi:pullulanase